MKKSSNPIEISSNPPMQKMPDHILPIKTAIRPSDESKAENGLDFFSKYLNPSPSPEKISSSSKYKPYRPYRGTR